MSHPQPSKGEERPQGLTYKEGAGLDRPRDPNQPADQPSHYTSQAPQAESTAILDDPNACASDHPRDAHLMSGALLPLYRVEPLQQDDPEPDDTPSAPSTPPEGTWSRRLYDGLRKVQEEREAHDESNDLPTDARGHGWEGGLPGEEYGEKERGSKGSSGSNSEEDDEDDEDDELMFEMEP